MVRQQLPLRQAGLGPGGLGERGPVLLCQAPAGVQGERCQAEGNQARRKLVLFEVSQCQIKEIKELFRVKHGEIKEAFFRFQSKPFVQFNLFFSCSSICLFPSSVTTEWLLQERLIPCLCDHQRDQDQSNSGSSFHACITLTCSFTQSCHRR